jgi:UDP-glucose 4-epimerase
MKVLVTGSSGFIGTNLMQRLAVFARPFDLTGERDMGSIIDINAAVQGMDAVVHLAAFTGVEPSIKDPTATLDNVLGTHLFLEVCRKRNLPFVLASTAGALADDYPRSPYAASKLACEAYCHAYAAHSRHKATAIPALCKAMLAGKPFEVYGDGSQERDFVYVGDVCEGIVQALKRGATGQYVLASGTKVRLMEVIERLGEISGRKVEVVNKPARVGEVEGWRDHDIAPARERFGFKPKTELADGLKQTWEWFSTQAAAR